MQEQCSQYRWGEQNTCGQLQRRYLCRKGACAMHIYVCFIKLYEDHQVQTEGSMLFSSCSIYFSAWVKKIMLLGVSVHRYGMVWAWEVQGLNSIWPMAIACWRGVWSPRDISGTLEWEISRVQPLRFSTKSAPWVAFSMNIFWKSNGFANLWRASQSSEAFCYGNRWEPTENGGLFPVVFKYGKDQNSLREGKDILCYLSLNA